MIEDFEKIQKKLTKFATELPTGVKIALEEAVAVVKAEEVRNLSGAILQSHRGRLAGAVETQVTASPPSAKVFINNKEVYKAVTHNEGKTITVRRKDFMRFPVHGQWVTVKSVTVPQRQFTEPTLRATQQRITEIIAKTLVFEYSNG